MKFFMFPLVWVLIVSGCGRSGETSWRDGNFKVYSLESNTDATRLGYDHRPGVLRLVGEEVVAAGSNAKWVVAEQLDHTTGETQFFIVAKEKGELHSGRKEGPMTQALFLRLSGERKLPAFSWRKPK